MTDERTTAQINLWVAVARESPPATAERAKVRAFPSYHWERENGRLLWTWPSPPPRATPRALCRPRPLVLGRLEQRLVDKSLLGFIVGAKGLALSASRAFAGAGAEIGRIFGMRVVADVDATEPELRVPFETAAVVAGEAEVREAALALWEKRWGSGAGEGGGAAPGRRSWRPR